MPLFCATLLLAFAVYLLGSLWFALGDTEAGWVREEGLQTFGLNKQVARSLEWALAKLPPSSLKITVELKTPGERWLGIFATCVSLVCGSVFISFVTNAMASLTRSTLHLRTNSPSSAEILQLVWYPSFVFTTNQKVHPKRPPAFRTGSSHSAFA